MMEIKYFDREDKFGYFWLKSVTGFDLSVHCARCILGKYDRRIWSDITHAENLELNSSMYYLCGVTKPYVWKDNFHLAFEYEEGSKLDIIRKGVHVIIENAKEITFSINDVNKSIPHADEYEYYSCRNWQFANKMVFGDRKMYNKASSTQCSLFDTSDNYGCCTHKHR